ASRTDAGGSGAPARRGGYTWSRGRSDSDACTPSNRKHGPQGDKDQTSYSLGVSAHSHPVSAGEEGWSVSREGGVSGGDDDTSATAAAVGRAQRTLLPWGGGAGHQRGGPDRNNAAKSQEGDAAGHGMSFRS
ncbi:unnamed protein product, partial [Sphacelaria rigidula]